MNHDPISRATPGGAAMDRRTGVGGLLRASRLRCGEELDVIAQILRIRRRHLQAIEDGNFDQLPGRTYAVGFIRTYADYLGLDSDEVVRRFKDEQTLQPGKPPKADLVFPSPMSESGIPRGAVVFLGVLVGVIAYGAWYTSTVDNDFFERWIEPVPARLATLLPSDARNDGPDRSQAVAGDRPAAAAPAAEPVVMPVEAPARELVKAPAAEPVQPGATQVPAEPVAAMTSAPEAVSETASQAASQTELQTAGQTGSASAPAGETSGVTPAPAPAALAENPAVDPARPPESIAQPVETAELPAPQASDAVPAPAETEVASTPVETADARIVLTAVSDSWVEVREQVTDAWIWGKLLRTGESYAVPDRPDLKMKTGNAGGLTISVDGASVPSVGASGEVVRNVLLDPDRLKAGTAVFR